MKTFIVLKALAVLLLPVALSAAELWDNGDTDGSYLGWGQFSSKLDDFYVDGAGWWLNAAAVSGFYLNAGSAVAAVQVSIWPHDPDNNEPNGDTAFTVPVQSFTAIPTGQQYYGYDEIKVNVTLDPTFLEGQHYYWIEFRVTSQSGTDDILLLARDEITHEPARYRIGNSGPATYPGDPEVDLAYSLQGDKVGTVIRGGGGLKVQARSRSPLSHTLYLTQRPDCVTGAAGLSAGLYEVALEAGRPQLYLFSPNGKVRRSFAFTAGGTSQPKFHTPLGDDMCRNAPNLIQQYCQTFVACAAYDMCE